VEFQGAGEKIRVAASERPNLVLTDIRLPVLDGYDATRPITVLPGFAASQLLPSVPSP
jgi:CheY-like chemotaxis protein